MQCENTELLPIFYKTLIGEFFRFFRRIAQQAFFRMEGHFADNVG